MKYIFFISLIFFFSSIFSQKVINKVLDWGKMKMFKIENRSIYCLNFDGAIYEDNNTMFPYYYELLPLNKKSGSAIVDIFNEKYEELKNIDINGVGKLDEIKGEIALFSSIARIKKDPFLQIKILPIRKNKSTGKLEKLISFSLNIIEEKSTNELKSKSYVLNSVLNSGKWVRVEVEKDGIYKIDYSKLLEWGFENPQNIRIFGYGGSNISMLNSAQINDDLIENSIWVEKGSDGIFNNGDYVIFYAQGPSQWKYNIINQQFEHFYNNYSSKSYYYITANNGSYKQIPLINTSSLIANRNVTTFDDYLYVEKNEVNLLKSGRTWFGERFDLTLSYDFPFSFANIDLTSLVRIKTSVAARSSVVTDFTFKANNTPVQTVSVDNVNVGNYEGAFAKSKNTYSSFTPNQSNININVFYDKKNNATSEGWLDYIDLHARRHLKLNTSQLFFRDINSVGVGNISEFAISNATSNTSIWDITSPNDIKKIETSFVGNVLTFKATTDSLKQFVAFESGFLTPKFDKIIENQDLHGLKAHDMIIVSHQNFLSQAEKLAEFHRENDKLKVVVVKPEQIYNEFSSGMPDVSAIRNFVKMFYDRAGANIDSMPKYLLLFGDGSFDNNTNSAANTNFILTYESSNSLDIVNSYTSDDFYGLLDDDEGEIAFLLKGFVDIGIGRLPVKNTNEADMIVNKIINYASNPKTMGDWQNTICLVGDDEDSNQHMYSANNIAIKIKTKYPSFNVEKIFLDAYPQLSTPAGEKYPDVNIAIANRIKKGSLIFNYVGHGNEKRFAHEGIIEMSDVNSWGNYDKLPFFITASCEISRWDDSPAVSIGEMIFLNPNGGGIGLFSSSRLVYAGDNSILNENLFNNFFKRDASNKYNKIGDAVRLAKSNTGSEYDINNRKFTLLCDPALQLAIPEEKIITDSINSSVVAYNSLGIPINIADTVKAFEKVIISGHIESPSGILLNNFTGTVYATVYDKAKNITTLSNDGGSTMSFEIQDNILYKGKASVAYGRFKFSFLVPKDISYNYGYGKISYYANNSETDAQGYYNNFIIGGSSDLTNTDKIGPHIKLYMNDENFAQGGITNSTPKLLAYLSDSSGINTVGSGIGHDITCVIDNNVNKAFVLNDFYESDKDSYQSGKVNYIVSSLSEGTHTIKLKAWDIFNNSSEETIDFVIANNSELALNHVFNYPNPFTDNTRFYFYHNQPNIELDVLIQIFTVTGKLIKTINTKCLSDGNLGEPMFNAEDLNWDGKDDFGDQISRGVYIYRIKVKTQSGKVADKFEKLVILK